MDKKENSKSIYKKWWFWAVIIVLLFIVIPSLIGGSEKNNITETQEVTIEVPQYRLLDKFEHISTVAIDDQESYFGSVLFEGDIMSISPEKLTDIAKLIVEEKGLNHSATFYITEEAYKADLGIIHPEENRELLEMTIGINEIEEFRSQQEIDSLLYEGYVGIFIDGEFKISTSSAYYQHYQESN